jgi:hypothetical protein
VSSSSANPSSPAASTAGAGGLEQAHRWQRTHVRYTDSAAFALLIRNSVAQSIEGGATGLLGDVVQAVFQGLLMGVFSLGGDVGRRHRVLRNAGLTPTGPRAGEWSPEAVATVLAAFDPARFAPREGELEPYQFAAEAIFEGAPVYERFERPAFGRLVSRIVTGLPDASPTSRGLDGAAGRLLEMHDAAFRRLAE